MAPRAGTPTVRTATLALANEAYEPTDTLTGQTCVKDDFAGHDGGGEGWHLHRHDCSDMSIPERIQYNTGPSHYVRDTPSEGWWYIGLSVRSERLLRLTSTMTPSKVISDMGHPLDSVNAGSLRTIQFDVAKNEQNKTGTSRSWS